MNSNLNLNWLKTFEAAARLSGFSAAGRELGLTQVAVSQQIKALESKLGHDLFIRHAKKVQLTDAGKSYLTSVREGLEKLNHATYGLFGSDIKRTIVVRGSIAVLTWLAPRLTDFRQRYPNIKLKFVTSIWPDPIDTQKIDIDIALVASNKHSESSENLSDEFIVPICGLEFSKQVLSIMDLLKLEPIQILGFDDHWSQYMSHFGLQSDASCSTQIRVDTSVLACDLVASGIGYAVVIERFAKAAIQSGRAIEIVGEPLRLHQSHVVINKSSNNGEPILAEIEAFREWVYTELHAA